MQVAVGSTVDARVVRADAADPTVSDENANVFPARLLS